MIYIAYDSGYKEINAEQYPVLTHILSQKILEFNDKTPTGNLQNVRRITTMLKGEKLILSELFLSPLHYHSIVQEINAGEQPVLFYKPLNCMIQIKRETLILKN